MQGLTHSKDMYLTCYNTFPYCMQSSGDGLPFSDLENVESWLNHVYGLLCMEPDRSWMATAMLPEPHSSREPSSDALKPCIRYRVLPSCPLSDNTTVTGNDIGSSDCSLKPAVSIMPVEATMEEDGRDIVHPNVSTSQTLNLVILMHSVDCEVGTTDDRNRLALHNLDSILDGLMVSRNEVRLRYSGGGGLK